MFNRLVLAALFAALTAVLGSGSDAVYAEPGAATWLTDGTIQGTAWQGLPDNQDRTAKFVVLDGPANNGLGQFASLGQMTTLSLTFDQSPENGRVRVALFDPNTIGNWDQRVDSQLVNKAPDVVYEIFTPTALVDGVLRCTDELLFDANPANDPAPIFVTSAYKDYNQVDGSGNAVNDDVWCALGDWTTAEATAAGFQLADGRFRLVLRARLRPAPRDIVFGQDHNPLTVPRDISSFTGRERAGYKIAFNGTYLIPAGGVVGFAGGVIDERVVCAGAPSIGCASTQDPTTRVVDPTLDFADKVGDGSYFYDGLFNFHLHSSQACKGDIEFFDADADWVDVDAITAADLVDANLNPVAAKSDTAFLTGSKLTGIPPENVGRYIRPNDLLCDGKRDIGGIGECTDSNRLVGGVIAWRILSLGGFPGHNTDPFDPAAIPAFSSAADATDGHPSLTAAQEPGGPFKKNTLDQAKVLAGNGLWCVQWYGLDMANFVFLRFNVPVGTTPRPSVKVDVFCDLNSNCERDDGDTAVPINGGVVNLKLTEVDCETELVVPNGSSFEVSTDSTGVWSSADCPAIKPACYLVEFVGTPPLQAGPDCFDLPRVLDLKADDSGNQCVTLELPRDCSGMLSGDVYCEHGTDCSYDPATDTPLPAGARLRVIATPISAMGMGTPVETEVTGPATTWSITNLSFSEYVVSYAWITTSIDLSPGCAATRSVEITAEKPSVGDIDFGFACAGQICGNVYCEETDNCLLDAGTPDGPLPAGSQALVTLTPILNGQPDVANVQTRTVTAPETAYCFLDLPFGTYEVTVALLPGGPALELAPACEDLKTVILSAASDSVTSCDFGYICDADITGVVFCDDDLNQQYSAPPDKAPISATVQAQLIPAAGPLPAALSVNVGVDGTFAFNNIAPGKYVLKVIAIDPAAWQPLFDNVNGIEVTVPAGETREVLFPYDCGTCEIHGTVYCDDDLSGTLTLGDLRFAGVEVTANGPDAATLTATTNASGEYAFLDLEPGSWVITVDPDQAPYNTVPPRPTVPQPEKYTLECGRGDITMDIDFRSLCLGRIYGYVFQDPLGDCDGVYQEATDVPVDGARIRLTGPGILPAPNPREAVTNADGFYQFGDLPHGIYKVEILDPLLDKWVVLGLASATPREVSPIDLPRLGEKRVDFGFCIQKIVGVVFQDNPDQDCDGVYEDGVDIPVDGARVRLTGPANLPAPNPRETLTDANGRYEFPNLLPGDYTVEILFPLPAAWEALELTLIAGVTPAVQATTLPRGEIRRIDFGFCVQALCGKVFKQPYGFCDGVWSPDLDIGLAGVLVELTGTSGDALGYTDSTRTDANGDYAFNNVPTGTYEIRLSETDAQTIAILAALIDDGVSVLTPTVDVGQKIPDLDFPKCECEQKLCVNVFREEAAVCDGTYDQGVDKLAEFIQVRFEQVSTGRSTVLMTDGEGRICLPIKISGDYRVSVDPQQPTLVDCRPSPNTVLERVVSFDPKECADQELWFGFCCCTKLGCCEGKLHEVVLETRFWQCPGPQSLEATARMYMDCGGDDLVDEASAKLVAGEFGSAPGIGGVVKVESITWQGPIVTVRVRLTAAGTRFSTGSFGNDQHLVTVTLNGETSRICDVFRAEVLRPGAIPGCAVWNEELCRWVPVEWPCEPGVSYREIDWDAYPCENLCWKFGVVEIWCFKDWCRCNCYCPPTECEPCTGKVTDLTLRYDGDKPIWTVLIQSFDGRLLFEGEVKPGDVIPLVAKGDDGTMGPEVKLFTNEVCTPIKTNCEDPLGIGTQVGPFTVIAGASSEGGPFCDPTVDANAVDANAVDANGRAIAAQCRECCIVEKPCDCVAGVTHLALRFTGETEKWVVLLQTFDGRLLFEGMLQPGDVIRVQAQGDDGTMGSTIMLLTNEFCGELDVTCRSPIGIGTTSGPFVVIGGASRDGGRFCGSEPRAD